jgi:cytochrome c biogenesis protein
MKDGSPVYKKDIRVNHPMRYKGLNIFQSYYGALEPREITLNIVSAASNMSYVETVGFGEELELPEKLGKLVISDFQEDYNFMGHNLGETFFATHLPPEGESQKILLPSRYKKFDRMRKGTFSLSIMDYTHSYYTGLQITRDPGVPLVYTGFFIMILGILLTFFLSHKRIYIEVNRQKNKCQVMVAGTANKNRLGMANYIRKLSDNLQNLSTKSKKTG